MGYGLCRGYVGVVGRVVWGMGYAGVMQGLCRGCR